MVIQYSTLFMRIKFVFPFSLLIWWPLQQMAIRSVPIFRRPSISRYGHRNKLNHASLISRFTTTLATYIHLYTNANTHTPPNQIPNQSPIFRNYNGARKEILSNHIIHAIPKQATKLYKSTIQKVQGTDQKAPQGWQRDSLSFFSSFFEPLSYKKSKKKEAPKRKHKTMPIAKL